MAETDHPLKRFVALAAPDTDEELATMAEQMITRDYGLPETPMMRKLREEGRAQGREEGREEGLLALLLRQLTRRCGSLPAEVTTQVQQLEAAQMLDLAEALLDFTSVADLTRWLATRMRDAG